jgi:hypothetical protein
MLTFKYFYLLQKLMYIFMYQCTHESNKHTTTWHLFKHLLSLDKSSNQMVK